ncbi:predicted protein, partial [Mycobacterium tuberculosis T17]
MSRRAVANIARRCRSGRGQGCSGPARIVDAGRVWTGGHVAGRPLHAFEVVATRHLAPHMVRVVLGGSGFDTFVPSDFTDSYIKLVFVDDDVDVGRVAPAADPGQLRRPAHREAAAGAHHDRSSCRRRAREIAVNIVLHVSTGS